MRNLLIVLGATATLTWAQNATAQLPERPREPGKTTEAKSVSDERGWRDGWLLGIGPLGGLPLNNNCTDCSTSPAFGMDMQIGRMLNPRLALMLDTHGVAVGRSDVAAYNISTTSVVQGVAAFAVQWWPAERVWVKGGIGHGEAQGTVTVFDAFGASVDLTAKETGFGMTTAAGYELVQGKTFALDAHVRYAGIHTDTKYRGSLVVGVGFAWFL